MTALASGSRPLSGKVALITGSSRRIGKAVAASLAAEGAHVVVHALQAREEVEAVAREIRANGGGATAVLADITDEKAVEDLVRAIEDEWGRIDILVNNAAIRNERKFTELSYADWRSVLDVIVDGTFLVSRAAVRGMISRGAGRIISIGGVSAHLGVRSRVHVATAKAALVGFTKALAVEVGGDGITANLVVPGRIGGPRSQTSGVGGGFPGGGRTLVARQGVPEDVAEVVRMLALPSGDFITGQTIHVNGGVYMP